MPFDPTPMQPAVSRNGVEVGKLRVLSEALRGEMPGWKWDFRYITNAHKSNECGTAGCAIGLAYKMGLISKRPDALGVSEGAVAIFGLSRKETRSVFGDPGIYGFCFMDPVRPAMVADALDRIIAREEAP